MEASNSEIELLKQLVILLSLSLLLELGLITASSAVTKYQ